jgi:tRNA G26 N,N-dimethylase Trm1
MHNTDCPVLKNGGLIISWRVLRLKSLNKLQQQVLAYVENCGKQCKLPYSHIATILGCSERRIQNAMDALACWGFFVLDAHIQSKGLRLDDNAEAWHRL